MQLGRGIVHRVGAQLRRAKGVDGIAHFRFQSAWSRETGSQQKAVNYFFCARTRIFVILASNHHALIHIHVLETSSKAREMKIGSVAEMIESRGRLPTCVAIWPMRDRSNGDPRGCSCFGWRGRISDVNVRYQMSEVKYHDKKP